MKSNVLNLSLEKSIFSDYYFEQIEKDRLFNMEDLSKRIHHKFVMIKGKFFRKYVIDMINCYQVDKLLLNFDKSEQKNKMKIKISSLDLALKKPLKITALPQVKVSLTRWRYVHHTRVKSIETTLRE